MRIGSLTVAAACVAVASMLPTALAHAQEQVCVRLPDGGYDCRIVGGGNGGGDDDNGGGGDDDNGNGGGPLSLFYTTQRPKPFGPETGWDIPCAVDYSQWVVETWQRAVPDDILLSSNLQCLADGTTPTAPPPPPPPPTLGQVVSGIRHLLDMEAGLSPPADGLGGVSQLETWFWCSSDDGVSLDLNLGGWSVHAESHPAVITWTIDGPDGRIVVSSNDCGAEPAVDSDGAGAAATWTPNEPGNYTVTMSVEWRGSWTRSFGGASQTLDLGTVTVDNVPIDYPVVEIQTVGTRG